ALGAEALDPLDQHPPVPGSIEDRELAPPREVTPETPEVRLSALLLGGRGDRVDVILAGVERARHPADGAALSGRVRALEDRDHGDVPVARVAAQQRELALVFFELV